MITTVLLAVGGVACSEEENLRLNLFLVEKPGAVSPRCSQSASTTTRLATGTYTLRLSFMRRAMNTGAVSPHRLRKAYELVCDRIIKPGEALDFQVPANHAGNLIMRLEAFQRATPTSAFQLAYSGQMEGTDLGREDLSLLLRATDQLSCSDTLGTPRAFHSATLLPDGQVLILGGLVAESSGKGDKLHIDDTEVAYATSSAELYNPDTMQFTTLARGLTTQRAFHKAILLPSPPQGPYEVMVIGGVTPETSGSAAFRLKAGSATSINYPFLISPHEKAMAAGAALVTITPSISGGAATLSDKPLAGLPRLMFPRVAMSPDGKQLVVAGGASAYTALGTGQGFTPATAAVLIALKSAAERNGKDPAIAAQTAMSRTRVGHAISPLGDNNYAVIGGTMDGPGPCGTPPQTGCDDDWEKKNAGELITAGSGGASATLMTFTGGAPEASGWHTLTPLGVKDGQTTAPKVALLAGGFLLGREGDTLRSVNTQTPKTYPLMQIGEGAAVTSIITSSTGAFKGGGYHAATTLANGSVLLSGGNVNSNFIKDPPCDKVTSPFCAYDQLAAYGLISGVAALRTTTIKKMSLARFGHQTTRLMDNAVLFTGGVTLRKEQNSSGQDIYPAVLTGFTEVYNPRTGGPAEDPFDRPAGKDYDTLKGMAPGTSSCGVQEE